MTEETKFGVSRRTLAKGAAWSVPAVAVAAAAPAYAASKEGPLQFTGKSCKLPGNSNDLVKGYVLEMVIENKTGANPWDAYIEITGVTAGGVFQPALAIKLVESEPTNLGTPSCGPCGSSSRIRIASPDGSTQRLLLFTANSGDSQNTSVVAHYNLYDCNETSSCGQPTEYSTDTTAGSTRSIRMADPAG